MKLMSSNKKLVVIEALSVVTLLTGAKTAFADDVMHRLYNPNSGEHFYTASFSEKNHLSNIGWKYEGVGWVAPTGDSKGDAVYRLYNRNSGDHHYTLSAVERDWLVKLGWAYEGIGWYSAKPSEGKPMYRLYNPNARVGSHHYTLSASERDWLVPKGWRAEGIGWYAVKDSSSSNNSSMVSNPTPTPSDDGNYIPDGVTQLGNSGKLFSWAKADEWSRAQIADSSSKWYGYDVVLNAVYKDDHLVGFSPDFSKSNSGNSSTNTDGSSTVPDGATKLGNSGKFFERIEDANAWAEKQVKDASSEFYGRTYYPTTIVKLGIPVGYSIQFNEKDNNSDSNLGDSDTNNQLNHFEVNSSEIEKVVVQLVNDERKSLGLGEIRIDKLLTDGATIRSKEIEIKYSHIRPDGTDYDSLLEDDKYYGIYAGVAENITETNLYSKNSNIDIANSVYNMWKNSRGHYMNMINRNVEFVGVGTYRQGYSLYCVMWLSQRIN